MSIVAAYSSQGRVHIGSNTGYTLADDSVINSGVPPWIFVGDWAIGLTGSMLALNVCRSDLQESEDRLNKVGDLVIAIGKILSTYDIGVKRSDETTWSFGIWSIIAHTSGRVWDLDESLCLAPIPEKTFWARGSGEKYALGASKALLGIKPDIPDEYIMKHAIMSAISNDLYSPGDVFYKLI